ncbi:MAG: hypothetical protein AB1427_22020, partial [Thermodesulfobacteriota bacterium]
GFGTTPAEVSYAVQKARTLLGVDAEFAYSFIKGYAGLLKYLGPAEIDAYIENAKVLLGRSPKAAFDFLEMKTRTARMYVKNISREARLPEQTVRLKTICRAFTGRDFTVSDLGALDADEIIAHNTAMAVCLDQVYLPARILLFDSVSANRDYYRWQAVIAAAAVSYDSFAAVHGKTFACSQDLLERTLGAAFHRVFLAAEIFRVLHKLISTCPGLAPLYRRILRREITAGRVPPDLTELLQSSLRRTEPKHPALKIVYAAARQSISYADTLLLLRDLPAADQKLLCSVFPGNGFSLPFFPDYTFPFSPETPPLSRARIDLRDLQELSAGDKQNSDQADALTGDEGSAHDGTEKKAGETEAASTGYYYDEWNETAKEYYEKWCRVTEKRIPPGDTAASRDALDYSAQVRRIFERLRPDIARREKFLPSGDSINIDELVSFLVSRRSGRPQRERFYEKSRVLKRDLSVALLLDASGSTGEECGGGKKVLDLEKDAACVLAEGLHDIGDRFSIYGFSGSGRDHSEFYIYKDFSDDWNEDSRRSLFAARSASSTRMGAAI